MAPVSKVSEEGDEAKEKEDKVQDEKLPLLNGRSRSLSDYGSLSEPSPGELACRQFGHGVKIEVQYTPKPISDMSPRKLGVVLCILSAELFERLAYSGLVANLILFCTSVLKFSTDDAITISLVFTGTTYLLPVLGGYISDAHLGMFNTIYLSCLIDLLGFFLLPCSAIDYQELFGNEGYTLGLTWRRGLFFGGLVLVSIGTAGIEANIGPFGARQVQDSGPRAIQTFFNWYYWFLSAGFIMANIGVAAVQQNVNFALGFFLLFISMVLTIFFFLLSRTNYRYRKAGGSALSDSFAVCWQSCKRSSDKSEGAVDLFDKARKTHGGSFTDSVVDGAVSTAKMMPFFIFSTIYCAVYVQGQSTFFVQGERMDLHIGGTQMPIAMLNAFTSVVVVLIIPFLDRLVYPWFQRINRPLTLLKRIGIGLFLPMLSMFAAALVEVYRKENLGFDQEVAGEMFFASNTTIFLQLPQFAVFGISEAFMFVSGLEFTFTQSPACMHGAMNGIYLTTLGLGSYLAAGILWIVQLATQENPWYPDEINDGLAEYFFYLMGGVMGVFFLAFLLASQFYKYRTLEVTGHVTKRPEKSNEASCDSSHM